jgi:hypothetical protein
MTHDPNEFDRPFDNESFSALDNNVEDSNITDYSQSLDSNYNSFDRPWQDNSFAGTDDRGLGREDYQNNFDRESPDWQGYDIYADSYQNNSLENHSQQISWEQDYNSQYIQDNAIVENNIQQTSWEQDYHIHAASPRSASLDSQNIELANDHLKQAKDARDLADDRIDASKEFAESNMPDSVNKYLDRAADALKEAEKHETEAQKLLDKK